MRATILMLVIATSMFSCSKENVEPGQSVEIYLLKTYQSVPGKCQVDPLGSTIRDTPAISNHEILDYSRSRCEFRLSASAIQEIRTWPDRQPFAVAVDRQVIYFGIFKPVVSSSTCENSITLDVDINGGNKIYLRLGYPWTFEGVPIDDQRNNARLVATLKRQGKLK